MDFARILRLLGSYAAVGVTLERTDRHGTIEALTARSAEHRATLALSLVF